MHVPYDYAHIFSKPLIFVNKIPHFMKKKFDKHLYYFDLFISFNYAFLFSRKKRNNQILEKVLIRPH